MAQASADIGETDLEQRILQVLKGAGTPVKAARLAKECQVPRKDINRVLYRMKDELKVDRDDSAKWRLREGGPGEVVPTEPAQPSHADGTLQDTVAVPRNLAVSWVTSEALASFQLLGQEPVSFATGPAMRVQGHDPPTPGEMVPAKPAQPSHELQGQILRLLEARGPQGAVSIARSLGMKTSKDVNRYLYAMQEQHLLDLDKNSKTWTIYQPGTPRAPPIIFQQSPVMICQNGPHSHISIQNSEAVQIGHGNTIVKLMAPAESGSTASCYLPPPPAAGPLGQDPPAGSWGPQDIRIDNSVLKYVQLGQGNEMNVHSTPATGPGHSPPVSAATAGPEASFENQMPTPGPHPEGEGDEAQRVPIKPCFLEEDAIGNSNSLSVCRAGTGAGAGPEASRGDPGELAEDAAPGSRAAEPRGKFPDGAGPADPHLSTFASHLEAMTLEDRDSEAPEDSP